MSYTTLKTNCQPIVLDTTLSFPSSAYNGVNTLPAPAPLPITITITRSGSGAPSVTSYVITFGNNNGKPGSITFTVLDSIDSSGVESFSILNIPNIVSAAVKTTTAQGGAFSAVITFTDFDTFLNQHGYAFGSYNIGDTYTIEVGITCNGSVGIDVIFSRLNSARLDTTSNAATTVINDNVAPNARQLTANVKTNQVFINRQISSYAFGCTGCTGSAIIPNLVRIPIINILGQTTVDGDFLSDFTFNIQDKYQYYDNTAKIDCKREFGCKQCEAIYANPNCLKTTKFFQYGPDMQCVVKGKGKTLRDKILYTYNRNSDVLGPSFQNFYVGMITYGMLKYILAKVLYGDFNVKYLCHNFNCQFFKDLARSRFCGFIEFFDDPANGISTYYKYFKNCNVD